MMVNSPKYKVSIVGDLISKYVGFKYGYPEYYKDDNAYNNGINSVDDTWWKQVIDGIGGEMCVNNSFSGSSNLLLLPPNLSPPHYIECPFS